MNRKKILIAGGTGMIGRKLSQLLEDRGHDVFILSRSKKDAKTFLWDPVKGLFDVPNIGEIEVLINLSGAGIADEKWTEKRKKELIDSRVGANLFLHQQLGKMSSLKHFICSSGINSYGFEHPERLHPEEDPYGTDFVSNLVKDWELSADSFKDHCKVTKIRTAIVLEANGGALKRMLPPIKMGIGSPLGTGDQYMPWIHIRDLIAIFDFVIENELEGVFNAVAGCESNRNFMKTLASSLGKPFIFPSVPSFVLKLMFGEMSIVLLNGVQATNEKIRSKGFQFNYLELTSAFDDLFRTKSK